MMPTFFRALCLFCTSKSNISTDNLSLEQQHSPSDLERNSNLPVQQQQQQHPADPPHDCQHSSSLLLLRRQQQGQQGVMQLLRRRSRRYSKHSNTDSDSAGNVMPSRHSLSSVPSTDSPFLPAPRLSTSSLISPLSLAFPQQQQQQPPQQHTQRHLNGMSNVQQQQQQHHQRKQREQHQHLRRRITTTPTATPGHPLSQPQFTFQPFALQQQQVTDKAPASGNSNDSSLFGLPLATPTVSAQSSGTYNGDVAASLLQPEMCIHSDNNRASPQSNHTLAEHTPGTFDSTLATNIAQPADSKTVSGGKSLGKERALLGDSSASYPLASKNGTGPGDAQALQPHIASEPLIVASAMVDAAMPIKCDLLVAPGHPSPVTGSGTRGQTRAPQPLGTCSPSAIAAQISQQAASTHMDRCTTHPGTRNDLWCETCEMAICTHCAEGTGIEVGGTLHHAHSVVKLAAAYDDTFEAIESLQIKLVGNLSETRQRNALLDSALAELAESYARAQEAMDEQLVKDTERVEKAFRDAQAGLQRRLAGCAEWRSDLDETLKMVQQMVEDFSQAQAVSERSRILELLTAASQARPDGWNDRLPDTEALLASEVKPAWRYATLPVPSVLDLGRKRGHVRVVSDPFSAHGVVWQVEARRSRSRLGVPCLSVTVNCTEGCEDIAGMYRISVHLVKAPSADVTPRARASSDNRRSARLPAGESTERFKQQFEGPWRRESSHTFMLCALDALQESDALSDSGSTTVRFGVVPESFRSLAQAQEERIRVLEERIRGLQRGDSRDSDDLANGVAMSGGGGGGSGSGTASLRPSRRRRSEGRGWATSPRVARRSEASMSTHSRTRSGRAPAQPLPLSPQPPPPLATGFTFSSQQSRPVQNQHPSPMLLLSPVSHIVPSSSSSSDCAAGASSQSIVGQPSPSGSRSAKAAQRPNSLGIVQRQQQQQQAQPVSPTSIVSPPQTMAPVLYSDPQSANSSSTGGFTLIGRGSVSSNNINAETGTGKPEHRRAISLTTKLRRQPPIPFPLNAQSRSLTSAGSSGSQSSSSAGGSAPSELVSPTDDKAGVLRRLSGWVRNTEGRFAQQAKRVRQLAAAGGGGRRNGSGGVCGEIDDWTFLDKSFSPNFPRSPHRMVALGIAENGSPLSNRSSGRRPLWPMRAADADASDTRSQQQQHQPPPPSAPDLRPLQALSARAFDAAGLGSDGVGDVDVDDGFAFDGAADIQRVQEEVDARAEHRRLFRASAGLGNRDAVPPRSPSLSPSPPSSRSRRSNVSVGALQARYDSILQRVDALQLIANTVENSRDGFTEGTLRRVSSELGMLMDGRRRRLEEARAQGRGGATSPRVVPPRVRALSPESFSSDLSSCDFGEPSADSEGVLRGMRYYALGKPNHAGAFSRRSVSMGPAEIRRTVMRCDLADGDCDGDDVPVLSLISPTASSQQQQPPSPTPSVKSGAPVDLVQGLLAKSLGTMSVSSPRLAAFRPSNSPALSRNAELRVVPGCASMAKSVSEPARLSSDGVGAFPSSMPETVFSLLMSPELSGACKDARMNALIAATHPSPAKDGVPLSLSSSAASSGRSSQSRRLSITSASSTSSVGRSPARITRPGGSNGKRRESFSGEATPLTSPVYSRVGVASVSRSGTPVKAGSSSLGRSAAAQLTPQANRKGGILKAGRSRRATPARLHTLADLPSLNEDGAIGADVSDVSLAQAAEERVWAGSLGDPAATGALGALQEERVGKARRSSTLPAALDEPRLSGASTPPSREHSAQRQPRSARASRKRVRFPEERRLLETIRLIDPRVAQSIEQRAAIKAAGDGEDTDGSHHSLSPASLLSDAGSQESTPLAMTPAGALRLSPPPAFRLDGHQQSKEDDEDDECDVRAFGGLAARVRLSPRLSAKSLRPPPAAETHFDNEGASSIDSLPVDGPADPVFCSLAEEYSPAQSSDRFDTATSVLFDEAADQPIHAPEAAHAPMYKRPPIPPQLRSGRADGAGEELPGGVCLDSGERMLKSRPALIFDRSGLLSAAAAPGSHFNAQVDSEEASSPGSEFDDDDDDNIPLGRMYRNDISSDKTQGRSSVVHTDSSLSDLSLPLIKEATLSSSMLADEQNAKNSKTSRRVLHVGPNVASAQSSPQAKRNVKSSNESSPSDGDDGLVAGPSLSTHLYRGDVKAFGSEQIPAIAHGRDTAFKGLLKPSSGGHVQGSDLMC
ncbi:hypothetical protein GQ54DRAFT_194573 [Martensiomyces pterosporus]|nr:hypothetical protein GQ54DRAFT_194573 [Martensiomyces pterosporus]